MISIIIIIDIVIIIVENKIYIELKIKIRVLALCHYIIYNCFLQLIKNKVSYHNSQVPVFLSFKLHLVKCSITFIIAKI